MPDENTTPDTNAVDQDNSDYNTIPVPNRHTELPPFPKDQQCYLSYNPDLNPDSTSIDQAQDKAYHNISISRTPHSAAVSEQQKYLRITMLDDGKGGMLIRNINGEEFLFKLKSIDSGDGDETVMTLDKVRLKSFIQDFADGSFTALNKTTTTTKTDSDLCHDSQHLTHRDSEMHKQELSHRKSSTFNNPTTIPPIPEQTQRVHLKEPQPLNSRHPVWKTNGKSPETDNHPAINFQNNPIQHTIITPDHFKLWYKARKILVHHYSTAIDNAWFARLEATENTETKTITLKVPSLFVHDWIKTNYLNTIIQVVQHISTTTGQYKLKLVI